MPLYGRQFHAQFGDEDPDRSFVSFEAVDDNAALKATEERCRPGNSYTVFRKVGDVEKPMSQPKRRK
ncbi:MAG: hypothetical protein ABA06_04615 [Parcubacteria bacterium C7867-001]|nr:MAG: hypothetical protein ABA06_04615 [Parcubacteria bacterium C7867-001]